MRYGSSKKEKAVLQVRKQLKLNAKTSQEIIEILENSQQNLEHLQSKINLPKQGFQFPSRWRWKGVNKRLDSIPNDSTFTSNLTLISPIKKRFETIGNDAFFTRNLTLIKSFDALSCQFTDVILDRFCLEILPKINDKIERLNVESSFMERILRLANYRNLRTLGLYDVQPEPVNYLFSDESYLIRHYRNQILSLSINMKRGALQRSVFGVTNININIFSKICSMFKNLEYSNFSSSSDYEQLTFCSTPSIRFSNLLELHVVLKTLIDCLCLLDGNFNKLNRFYVTICPRGLFAWPLVNNKNKLLNLKCFSLIHEDELLKCNEIFLPLLQRMSNLEELSLYFFIPYGPITDGDYLKENILNHMRKLNKFTFNIRSTLRLNNQVNLLTNQDIQSTFENFKTNEIISYIDYFSKSNLFNYHIYSYPYRWTCYDGITNNFPGGLFQCVREISLRDERPFEHEFFLRIAQSFPFIEKLCLNNHEPQQNPNLQSLIIKYPHLTELDLVKTHENYVEQFLNNSKTRLLKNVYLRVNYGCLQKATDDFRKDATRINSSKIIGLLVSNHKGEVEKSKSYFPQAEFYCLL
ncbi:unnamed protein product [Rotaria sordida]|uniref:Uncharacterized protein n=1 Tax=Rotaria sordida TaxID=392033 RepID=A0A819H6Q9_9BILA|nr:unnamed protein product [Rotaria sordida]